jgi:hypothetical protein
MGIHRCEVATDSDGMMTFRDAEGVVALRMPSGRVVDCRLDPPFYAIVPCPWCVGVHGLNAKGREHDPVSHIDPELGTPWKEPLIDMGRDMLHIEVNVGGTK